MLVGCCIQRYLAAAGKADCGLVDADANDQEASSTLQAESRPWSDICSRVLVGLAIFSSSRGARSANHSKYDGHKHSPSLLDAAVGQGYGHELGSGKVTNISCRVECTDMVALPLDSSRY